MKYTIQRIFLIPLVIPIIAILVISGLNNNKVSKLKVLTWESPSISLSLWISLSYTAGAILSSSSSLLLTYRNQSFNRKVKVNSYPNPNSENSGLYEEEFIDIPPERPPNDPAPTVSVPFRIIRKSNRDLSSNSNNQKINSINKDNQNYSNETELEDYSFSNYNSEDWDDDISDW